MRVPFLLVSLLWSGCDTPDDTESTPETAEQLYALWASDPEDVAAALQSGDQTADLLLLETLLTEHPTMASGLCPRLLAPAQHQRCITMQQRPHLWARHPSGLAGDRPAGGPSGKIMRPHDLPDPFAALEGASPRSCPEGVDLTDCTLRRAADAAKKKELERAARLCRSIPRTRWRQECMFSAAEARLRVDLPGGYADAAALCAAAGAYMADCLMHLTTIMSENVPVATAPPERWAPLLASAETLRLYWAPREPLYGALAEDLLWAEALLDSYQSSTVIAGNPLDILPAAARPHIHAAAAYRLVSLPREPITSMAAWSALLDEALEHREALGPMRRARQNHSSLVDLWPQDAPGEEIFPAAHYLAGSRRAISPDDAVDRQIALMEAIVRLHPPRHPAVVAVADDDTAEPILRWTARRLLAH